VTKLTVELPAAANDMVQEEIVKQIAHISRAIRVLGFRDDQRTIDCEFSGPSADAESVQGDIDRVARKIQRSLRQLDRKLVYRTPAGWDRPAKPVDDAGVWNSGVGQVQLSGPALQAVRSLTRLLDEYIAAWHPVPIQTPTLIPAPVLARCDYFRSFPQYVSFVSHLHEEFTTIDAFRSRHQERDTLDETTRTDLDIPDVCLSPAVCYHIYHRHAGETLPATGTTYDVAGRCFRYESTNLSDLRRLWEFTMRELVFVGTREWVLDQRQRAIDAFIPVLDALGMPAEIRTASDPFFVAPEAGAKTYFQLSSETKYEISVDVGHEERLAVGSFNYHTDFFGKAFGTNAADAGAAHSVCVAFGLERLAHAVLVHYGPDALQWPEVLRRYS
jgi:seryl-tRNA synthetase